MLRIKNETILKNYKLIQGVYFSFMYSPHLVSKILGVVQSKKGSKTKALLPFFNLIPINR